MTESRAQLAETVRGLSDEDLKAQIQQQGIDQTLKTIFEGMEEAFLPDKAGSTTAVIQYEIDTDEGAKAWTVNIADGKAVTSEGQAESPRLTLKMGVIDFVRVAVGQAQGQQLFMTGKLKLTGDMMFAMQMQNFFQTPS